MESITRRGLLKAIPAGLALIGLRTAVASPRRYGAITVAKHYHLCQRGVHLHVFHEGNDVTKRCMYADDAGDGMAELQLLNDKGRPYTRLIPAGEYGTYTGERELATEIVRGITIKTGAAFT